MGCGKPQVKGYNTTASLFQRINAFKKGQTSYQEKAGNFTRHKKI
jgi:hypothetical protein